MTNDNHREPNEDRLAALLRSIDADAPPPDAALLAMIGQRAAEAFAAASSATDLVPPATESPNQTAGTAQIVRSVPTAQPVQQTIRPEVSSAGSAKVTTPRKVSMVTLALRGLVGITAAAAAFIAWVGLNPTASVASGTPFSKVLEKVDEAKSLQWKLTKNGESVDVWMRAPGLVRWEETPQRYQIAMGSRLWKIDEEQNSVTEEDSPWFSSPQHQIDLFELLDIDDRDSKGSQTSAAATPAGRTSREGRDYLVYRFDYHTKLRKGALAQDLDIEALVEAETLRLVEIVARPRGLGRQAPPVAELQLVAVDQPVPDEKFVIAKSLTEDGRIGKITAAQGIAGLRPALASRWTPICRDSLLKPGDWLRTELRGANALKSTLSSDVEVTLGPGSLLECISPSNVRLHYGQAQVMVPKAKEDATAASFTLLAAREGRREFKPGDKQLVRIDRNEKLVDVPQTPVWLAGFEGTSNNESLGSLIVNVDGRNEPLSVGYHKVSVEIRDQIARTTIEESFVNHTPGRLEGVFHFPLPSDASISGFGMWIGNDLVEADVVEKQRAREIFETILREKRDPGLLEWTSGNIFKARVFPIEPHSEKRVKIVYTQVLPMRADRYRYSYGLRSEMLRTKPLRELSIKVTVNSALTLKSVTCPTHTVRSQSTDHSAQLEFVQQEYTPTRDFEVVCQTNGNAQEVVTIPHRRGADGYFIVQLTPPSGNGNWQRELLAEGNPLELVLLCDTSASMDSEKRRQQAEFVATVLSALGPKDKFLLGAADVNPAWAMSELVVASAENVTKAKDFLEKRSSLGWTNLDRAFTEVMKRATPGSQVIYVGDGIVSAGDTNPAAFVQRLKLIMAAAAKPGVGRFVPTPLLHAVTVGNTYDSVVMKGIAEAGRGSVRAIGGEQSPSVIALELLNEVAQPGLRDIKVEFRGLKVAAVYPEQLPKVAAGTQQILVGRYLPEGQDQAGEVIVTGMKGNEKVRYVAKINLKDAEAGNSFIPRLWARSHLDFLLAQGTSSVIRDDIIRLSEEFHIITPYTSLLVLESDADRERFGVKRRFEMRDGEKFFAQGKANANFELLQQQMKRAADWRIGLRRQVLQSLIKLGRDPQAVDLQQRPSRRSGMVGRFAGGFGGGGGGMDMNSPFGGMMPALGTELSIGLERAAFDERRKDGYFEDEFAARTSTRGLSSRFDSLFDSAPEDSVEELSRDKEKFDAKADFGGLPGSGPEPASADYDDVVQLEVLDGASGLASKPNMKFNRGGMRDEAKREADFDGDLFAGDYLEESLGQKAANDFGRPMFRQKMAFQPMISGAYNGSYYYNQPDYTSWVDSLFPSLEPTPIKPARTVAEIPGWSPEARALSQSLLRVDRLLKMDGGIELSRVSRHLDPRWKRQSGRSSDLALYSPTAWLTHGRNYREQTYVAYCNEKERGVYSLAFQLGRTRASVPAELKTPPLGLTDFSLQPLAESYPGYDVKLEPAGESQTKLIISRKDSTSVENFFIDTAKHVLVKHEWFDDGKLFNTVTYSDFVEMAGSWWATKVVTTDDQGRSTSETTLTLKALNKEQYAERMNAELASKAAVQFVHLPFVKLRTARQKVADGSAAFDDRLAMILYNAQLQQWDEMWKHVEAIEKLAAAKPGVRWLRTVLQITIRRNDEARQRLLDEAKKLAAQPQIDQLFLADNILDRAYGITGWSEFLELVNLLKPVYERPINPEGMEIADPEVLLGWSGRLAQCYDALGRREEAMELHRAKAVAAPWQVAWQTEYAQRLASNGNFDAAHAWLRQAIDRPERRADEDETLRSTVTALYRQHYQWAELLKWTTEWIARKPESLSYNSPYSQHLAAMICNDQLDAAYALADQWLKDAQVESKLTKLQQARLESALQFASGSLPDLNFNRPSSRWFEPLAAAARFFIRYPHHFPLVQRCVGNHYFNQSDISDQLRGEWLDTLRNDLDKLNPTQIHSLVSWTLSGRIELKEPLAGRKQLQASEVPNDVWQKISTALLPRWQQAADKVDRHLLGEALKSIYTTRFRESQLLPFLRQRIVDAHKDYQGAYINELFGELLATAWTDAIEQEAFAVLKTLYKVPPPVTFAADVEPAEVARLRKLEEVHQVGERLSVEIPALYRLVDAMLANRQSAAERQLNDQGGLDKLTRKELAAKKLEFRKEAKVGLAKRLDEEAKKTDASLVSWLQMEKMWLQVQLEQNLAEVAEECWKILGEVPPKPAAVDDDVDTPAVELARARRLEDYYLSVLRRRAFTTVLNLAVRKQATPGSIDRVLNYIDAGVAQHVAAAAPPAVPAQDGATKINPLEAMSPTERAGYSTAQAWKLAKFRFLIALDRADDLESALRDWIRTDVSTAPWRQWLGRLLAERGKLDEAIQLLEACEKDKLLSSADYRLLADWYLATNRRDAYERSRIEAYKMMGENYLARLIGATRHRWVDRPGPLPSELDEDTLFVFKALFEKSSQPENYAYLLRDLYGACRDFRLLQVLPDAALGRSPQQAYNYLTGVNNNVFTELRNEATADSILERINVLRERKLTATDLRALDLLEALVERKASEVLNQPLPHVTACVAAMQRAFQREWREGEPLMMATFLFQMGGITNLTLREEQVRELRELQKMAKPASRDHLRITDQLCQLMFWHYSQQQEAVREIEPEIAAYVQENRGLWPYADDDVMGRIAGLYEGANRHMAGETLLKRFIDHPENDEQRKWLYDRLLMLYNHALESNSAVSLGSNREELFVALVDLSLKDLETASNEDLRNNIVSRLTRTYDIGHRNKVPGTYEAMRKFTFETLPAVLKKQQQYYRSTVSSPIHQISEILGAKLTLQYIVERMEQYPQRLEVQWDNSWNTFGWHLAEKRAAVGSSDLDARVLKLVVIRLKEELRTGESNNAYIYRKDYSQHFWQEKTADFAKAAEEVLNERRSSGRLAMSVARYLHYGLGLEPRAIEILSIAHQQGILEESSQYELASWLRNVNRHGEAIPILLPLVAQHPDNIVYRTDLMIAYHRTQQPERLAELAKQTHEHFHQRGLWTEGNAAQLARGCLGSELWEQAAGYFTEAIALRQRANPASGFNDDMLSSYYQELARAESRLKHTPAAVTAASAAIVSWDARHQQRTHAVNTLRQVLSEAQNLDEYVGQLNADAAKTGQDSPILRKEVGKVYQSRNEFAKAIAQFKLAIELQPNDSETHQALIDCYDKTQDADAATRQLQQLIDLKPHDLALFTQLAERMKDNEPEAERAATSIIESAPGEAEGHSAMAELRQKQNRWSEAIPHWKQVAELRRLEPTGLLRLAQAQVHEKQFDAARETVKTLERTEWPSRFSDEVNTGLSQLRPQLQK